MKTSIKIIAVSLAMLAGNAQASGWFSYANKGICIARSGNHAIGWYCSSPASQTNHAYFNSYGQIRFAGTNLCLRANTTTTVDVTTCAITASQRWNWSVSGKQIWNGGPWSGRVLRWTGGVGSLIDQTNTYLAHPTREWEWW